VIRAILSPETNNAQRGKDDPAKRNLIKLQSLFESCMDEKKMSEIGVKPLADLIQKMIKVFPATLSILDTEAPVSHMSAAMAHLRDVNFGFQSASPSTSASASASAGNRQKIQQEQKKHDGDEESLVGDQQGIEPEGQIPLRVPVAEELTTLGELHMEKRAPAAAAAKPQREDLALAIAQLAWVGVTTMVDFDVDADPKNPDVNVFRLGENGLGLPSKEYYQEDKIVNIYQKTIEDMFVIVMGASNKGGESETAPMSSKPPAVDWAEVAKNVVEFEKLLAAISSEQEDLDNSELTYNPRSLSEITEMIPAIDWSLVLEKLLATGTSVPNPIIVSSPEYLQKLNALLKDAPAMTLQNYFAWRLIKELSPGLAIELRKPMQQLKAALQGVSADLITPRWETCVDVVDDSLGAMAGHYFIEKMFQGDSKELADSIVTSLRSSFVNGLNHMEWLDDPTLLNATEKVDLLIQKIGYSVESPDVRSSDSLEEYFKDLGIDKGDFFGNQIRTKTWQTRQTLGQLGKPVDKAKWLMNPQTVNAYYNPSANEIVFPAGILQQPFFHGNNPEYLNYGGIGVVAGHELSVSYSCCCCFFSSALGVSCVLCPQY
jgi:endothelin-converting enzyme